MLPLHPPDGVVVAARDRPPVETGEPEVEALGVGILGREVRREGRVAFIGGDVLVVNVRFVDLETVEARAVGEGRYVTLDAGLEDSQVRPALGYYALDIRERAGRVGLEEALAQRPWESSR